MSLFSEAITGIIWDVMNLDTMFIAGTMDRTGDSNLNYDMCKIVSVAKIALPKLIR